MSDFELFLLFLSLVLLVTSIVFIFRWIGGGVNDFIGLFSIAGFAVSIAVPYIVVPDALNHVIKVLLSPVTKVAKDLSTDILSDAESTAERVGKRAAETGRQAALDVRKDTKGSWLGWLVGGRKRRNKKKSRS